MPQRNKRRKQVSRRRRYNKRRSRRRMFTTQRYHFSVKPSTYGPGSYVFNATKLVNGPLNTQVTLNGYYDILYENPELERIRGDFKYFKFLGITVTFYSRNLHSENNQTPCYFLVNYDGLPTENLRLQDNVKVVPAFHIKNKIYKFKIPTVLASNGTLNAWVTQNEINNISQVLFQFHAPDNTTSWYFRIDIRMVCRGPTNVTELKEIKIKKEGDKDKEEGKEENDKGEINQNIISANNDPIKEISKEMKKVKLKDSQNNERGRGEKFNKMRSENAKNNIKEKNFKNKVEVKVKKEKRIRELKTNQVLKDKEDKVEDSFGDWDEYDDASLSEIAEEQGDILPPTEKNKTDDCDQDKRVNKN